MRKKGKLLFVVNPHSGKGQIKTHLLNILDLFVKHGWDVSIHTTQKPGDAGQIVEANAVDYDFVVCSGGDGTLNEVVNGMMLQENRVPIGYIPAGSTNDFAFSLLMPKNCFNAAEIVVKGRPFAFDVGRMNDRYFVYIAAFGAFTDVSYATPQKSKNLLGHAAYLLEGTLSLPSLKAYDMVIECNGEKMEDKYVYGMVTNSVSVGGFPNMALPDIKLDDGLFEVTLVKRPKNPVELSTILAVLTTNYSGPTDLIYSTKTDFVRFTSKEPVAWTTDGEFGGDHMEVEIQNECKVLSIMVAKEHVIEKEPIKERIEERIEERMEEHMEKKGAKKVHMVEKASK